MTSQASSYQLDRGQLKSASIPSGSVGLWWLGQAGFVIKSAGGTVLAIDPYLSNSCAGLGREFGFDMERQVPPPLAAADLTVVDALLLTHSHQDHLDPETLSAYRSAGGAGPYIAPAEAVEKLHGIGVSIEQTVLTWPNRSHEVNDVQVRATFAIPFAGDDLTHVGYLVKVQNGPTVYFSGDTAYHDILAVSVAPHRPDVMVAVINPAFRNMSPADAAHLAKQLDPRVVIPCHYDLFPDNCQPPQMLRTNLHILGIRDRYRELTHGELFQFPE